MKRKIEYIKLLKSEIISLMDRITNLEHKLLSRLTKDLKNKKISEEEIITLSYYISGIYSFYEDVFVKIANVLGAALLERYDFLCFQWLSRRCQPLE